jgi:hypothetical protein
LFKLKKIAIILSNISMILYMQTHLLTNILV